MSNAQSHAQLSFLDGMRAGPLWRSGGGRVCRFLYALRARLRCENEWAYAAPICRKKRVIEKNLFDRFSHNLSERGGRRASMCDRCHHRVNIARRCMPRRIARISASTASREAGATQRVAGEKDRIAPAISDILRPMA